MLAVKKTNPKAAPAETGSKDSAVQAVSCLCLLDSCKRGMGLTSVIAGSFMKVNRY